MNPAYMYALQVLLDAHDADAPLPPAAEGESVLNYWVRVIKFQEYERGYADGNGDGSITLWDNRNPYKEPTS